MELIFIILLIYLEAYSVFLAVYTVVKLVKKRKLPFKILFFNFILVAVFFFIRKLVYDHELIFIGRYIDATKDWGEGLANLMISIFNFGIVFLAFWITQIVFWRIFLRHYRKLNLGKFEKTGDDLF